MTDLARLPATELARRVRGRELSPVDLVDACIRRMDELDGTINAVVTRSPDIREQAARIARRLEEGEDPGPLAGLPVGIKEVTPVEGVRTTFGSPMYADHVPAADALVVSRLRAAGAVIAGKTNAPEFAAGGNTFNEVFGRTRNPWNPELSAGGSTGGGAAGLATGMIALAEGTDLGGSLRIPASFCGVVGLRPSPGLVPTVPTDWLWDNLQVTGPMARTAADVALMLQAICGPSPLSPNVQPVEGRDFVAAVERGPVGDVRVAYAADPVGLGIDPDVASVCRAAADELDRSGISVEEVELDLSYGFDAFLALRGLWMVAHQYSRLDRVEEFGPNVKANVLSGLEVSTRELGAAEAARARMWEQFRQLFEAYDHLLTPCMAVPPFPVDQNYPDTIGGRRMNSYVDWIAPTFVLSLTGLPVASVPAGLDEQELPVGLQIVGRPRAEEEVLTLAAFVQEIRPVGLPPL